MQYHQPQSTNGYRMPVPQHPNQSSHVMVNSAATTTTTTDPQPSISRHHQPINPDNVAPPTTKPHTVIPSPMTPITMSDIIIPKSLPSAPPPAQFADYVLYVDGQVFNSDPICQQAYHRIRENWINDLVYIQDIHCLPERKGWMKTLPVLVSRESKIAFVREHALNELDRYIQEYRQPNSSVLLLPPEKEQELPTTPMSETADEWAQALGNTNSRLHGQEYLVVNNNQNNTNNDANSNNNAIDTPPHHHQPAIINPSLQHTNNNDHYQQSHTSSSGMQTYTNTPHQMVDPTQLYTMQLPQHPQQRNMYDYTNNNNRFHQQRYHGTNVDNNY